LRTHLPFIHLSLNSFTAAYPRKRPLPGL
jgi:hypothetical protein